MPRVLHLFNVFGALTERSMLDYTLGLSQAGWDLTAGYEKLEPAAAPAAQTPLRLVQLQRINVEPSGDVPAQMKHISSSTDPAMLSLLAEKFDLVHGHFGPRILQGAAWLSRGVPMIVSLYGYDLTRLLRDPSWAERYRWAAAQGATFVTLAKAQLDRLTRLGLPPERIRLIRLGIHLNLHRYAPTPAPPQPRFVFIGRLVEKKGLDYLIRAIYILGQKLRVSASLDVIGEGPLEPALRHLCLKLRLQHRVRFLGPLPFTSLLGSLQGATALVQPSVTASDGDAEGAPMVLMHAQAVGVPCITTDHLGNPEVLPPDAARFVIPERNTAALAGALLEVTQLSAPARSALQAAGRRWIEANYDMAATVAGYDRLYRDLLAAPGPR